LGITVSSDTWNSRGGYSHLDHKALWIDIVLAEILPVINNKVLASAVSGLSIENLQNK
jgi:pyrroline-5-carboxylate reductase